MLVDTLQYLWQGKQPKNHAPAILRMELAGRRDVNFPRLRPNTSYLATAISSDAEGDDLLAEWELWPEIRPGAHADEIGGLEPMTGYLSQTTARQATLRTPRKAGAYRLLLWLHDGHGGVATANIPFYCGTATPADANEEPE